MHLYAHVERTNVRGIHLFNVEIEETLDYLNGELVKMSTKVVIKEGENRGIAFIKSWKHKRSKNRRLDA
ncbi:hypothetical protein POVCU2_0058770 [Plasmodium ovale curtisi]|uniref:Uncharacterized protein n=1 Tax=Plasmodium ovale curtisi TaxID=864141 RepID=A0A1A8WDV1_PLAOA|nr:hypothetical protein POVCU2_0058770 [Plasmodium ovale curtisi]SBS95262.1 hypothetical protein POVCU1_029340 [Plasmodium ovale curtisi]